jgi:hypothetical protein
MKPGRHELLLVQLALDLNEKSGLGGFVFVHIPTKLRAQKRLMGPGKRTSSRIPDTV